MNTKSLSRFAKGSALSQILLLILFSLCTTYDQNIGSRELQEESHRMYPMFLDVHIMAFVGFGFLMTFLARYSWSGVANNFFLCLISIQWAILVRGFFEQALSGGHFHKIPISLHSLITADYSAAAVLITFGVIIGNASPFQLLLIALIETVFSVLNESLGVHYLKAVDAGGSVYTHMFGGFFGLAVSLTMSRFFQRGATEGKGPDVAEYHSDVFAMIGTLFLFIYWPSFNAALFSGYQHYRIVINTVLSLLASASTTFFLSNIVHEGKFSMVHVQNATLAGGVMIGTSSNLFIEPWAAILIGMIAGTISTLGYAYLTDYLKQKFNIVDMAGVNNLHATPGMVGGIIGAIVVACTDASNYPDSLSEVFPALEGGGRSLNVQASYQFLNVIMTLGISTFSGVLTGYILRATTVGPKRLFDDSTFWVMEHGHEVDSSQVKSVDEKRGAILEEIEIDSVGNRISSATNMIAESS